ncbi:uncharacterized protein LOC134276995 [Saccostrea cucullata]|uniref:uncharacterized protein LOC134276995 n=1 Tax=Saccostrea cuccullata TaxID=36930 RepID=UPI002ED5E237
MGSLKLDSLGSHSTSTHRRGGLVLEYMVTNNQVNFVKLLLFFSIGNVAQRHLKCRFPYGLDCCDGYYRTYNNSCTACPSGFHGKNCSTRCIFPAYGVGCLEECRCNKSLCNFIVGCPADQGIEKKTSSFVSFLTTHLPKRSLEVEDMFHSTASSETGIIPYFFLTSVIIK